MWSVRNYKNLLMIRSKVFGVVSNSNDIEKLQIDLMNLSKWSDELADDF